ncbi:MAG: GNAT family N-acetyltransferase [Woeseia sp.]
MASKYQFSVLRTVEELDGLAQEWAELQWIWMMPLLDFVWVRANAKHFYAPGELHVVVARRQGTLAAVAPLARVREGGRSSLEFIGASFTRGPCGLPYREAADHHAMIRYLGQLHEPLTLRRWVVESSLAPSSRIRAGRGGVQVVGRPIYMPLLSISSTWGQYLKGLSSQRRYDINRAHKRMSELGTVEATFTKPGPGELDSALEQAFELEAAGWKGRNGTSIRDNPRLSAFYRDVAHTYVAEGTLVVAFLRCGDALVATQIALDCQGRYWVLKVGFDEAFSRGSPGFLLMSEAVKFAHERKHASVEFLGTDEPWLRAWTTETRECVSAHFLPYSIEGARSATRLAVRFGRAQGQEKVIDGEQRKGA